MSTAPFLRVDRAGPIVTLTLDRPDERNAFSSAAQCLEVAAALDAIGCDPSIGCVILTGAGSAFCAGGNVKDMQAKVGFSAGTPFEIRENYRRSIQQMPLAFARLDVPVIAAVNGPAIGLGCDVACMADIRIAGERAKFAESFVKVGIVPGDGGAYLLQRIIGYARAAELTFTGDTISAAEALAIGLVSRVLPDAELMTAARALATRIAANPGPAVRMAKRLLREALHQRLEGVLELSASLQALAHNTPEHKQAVDTIVASLKKG